LRQANTAMTGLTVTAALAYLHCAQGRSGEGCLHLAAGDPDAAFHL
jgi:hypothetical protein